MTLTNLNLFGLLSWDNGPTEENTFTTYPGSEPADQALVLSLICLCNMDLQCIYMIFIFYVFFITLVPVLNPDSFAHDDES